MFCQKCGVELSDTLKFCVKCGHKLKPEPRISNKAILLAAIAAVASITTSMLGFLPRDKPIKAQDSPTPIMAVTAPSVTPSPRSSPTPKPTQKPRQTPERTLELTPRPTLTWEPKPTPPPELRLMAPRDGAVFSHVPRRLTLVWSPVQEATLYGIAIEYDDGQGWKLLHGTYTYMLNLTMTFSSPLSARWRVTPIFNHGRTGDPSEWRTFQFTR